MKKKFVVLMFMFLASMVYLPSQAGAAASPPNAAASSNLLQIQVTIGKRRHRGWVQGRRAYWYDYDRHDRRYTRETYYVAGRPRVRWIYRY